MLGPGNKPLGATVATNPRYVKALAPGYVMIPDLLMLLRTRSPR
jgi:hypothetical protein